MSIVELLQAPERDLAWLMKSLQAAVELEFFTIPPYLTALWSIVDETSDAARTIREVVYEEMQHMAAACNLLAAIGGTPRINREPSIPIYPRPMPGGVRPDLIVGLSGLTEVSVKTFMEIERPKNPLIFPEIGSEGQGDTFETIGEFYEAVRTTFHALAGLSLSIERQVSGPLAHLVVADLDAVDRTIHLICSQGEGTDVSPLDDDAARVGTPVEAIAVVEDAAQAAMPRPQPSPDLAHYYRFQEIDKRRRLVFHEGTGVFRWGEPLPFPQVYPVAPIPAGGYRLEDVAADVAADLHAFDVAYTRLLDDLQRVWEPGGQGSFWRALEWMFALRDRARSLMQRTIPGSQRRYGPCFRYLGTSAV